MATTAAGAARGTGRRWALGAVLVALAMAAAAYLLVIAPARDDAQAAEAQVADAGTAQLVLRHRLRELQASAQDTTALQAEVAAAEAAIPARPDTQGLLRQLQTQAGAAGVTVGAVSIDGGEAAATPGLWSISVNLVLTGRPEGLLAVLGDLQATTGRAFTVAGASLDTLADGGSTLILDVAMYCTTDPTVVAGPTAGGTAGDTAGGTAGGTGPTGATGGAGGSGTTGARATGTTDTTVAS